MLDLAVGASATGRMSVTVNDPAIGDRSLQTVIVSNDPGSNCRYDARAAKRAYRMLDGFFEERFGE